MNSGGSELVVVSIVRYSGEILVSSDWACITIILKAINIPERMALRATSRSSASNPLL
jgi:hypothetical protein